MGSIVLYATYDPPCRCQGSIIFSLTVFHIIYLNYQLLEAIGAISGSDTQKASSRKGNYQDATTASLSRTHDDEAAGQEDGDQPESDITLLPDQSGSILSAVDKVSDFQFQSPCLGSRIIFFFNSCARLSGLFVQAHSASRPGSASLKHQHIQMVRNVNVL
jgi:hypothetical protein